MNSEVVDAVNHYEARCPALDTGIARVVLGWKTRWTMEEALRSAVDCSNSHVKRDWLLDRVTGI